MIPRLWQGALSWTSSSLCCQTATRYCSSLLGNESVTWLGQVDQASRLPIACPRCCLLRMGLLTSTSRHSTSCRLSSRSCRPVFAPLWLASCPTHLLQTPPTWCAICLAPPPPLAESHHPPRRVSSFPLERLGMRSPRPCGLRNDFASALGLLLQLGIPVRAQQPRTFRRQSPLSDPETVDSVKPPTHGSPPGGHGLRVLQVDAAETKQLLRLACTLLHSLYKAIPGCTGDLVRVILRGASSSGTLWQRTQALKASSLPRPPHAVPPVPLARHGFPAFTNPLSTRLRAPLPLPCAHVPLSRPFYGPVSSRIFSSVPVQLLRPPMVPHASPLGASVLSLPRLRSPLLAAPPVHTSPVRRRKVAASPSRASPQPQGMSTPSPGIGFAPERLGRWYSLG